MSLDAQFGGEDGALLPDLPEETVRALSHPHRSTAMSILRRHDGRLETTDLATRVVARLEEKPLLEVSRPEHDSLLVSLHHHHLPKLEEQGLVEWDRTDGSIALEGDSIRWDRLRILLEAAPGGDDALVSVLSNGRRRAAFDALADGDGAATVAELARRVAARERGVDPDDVSGSELTRVHVSLHHAHVPAMEAAGVLECDEDGRVELSGFASSSSD